VREVYVIQWERPHLVVDITATMDLKLEAIRCHASQVGDVKAVETRYAGIPPRGISLSPFPERGGAIPHTSLHRLDITDLARVAADRLELQIHGGRDVDDEMRPLHWITYTSRTL